MLTLKQKYQIKRNSMHDITFTWIPAHINISGNEEVQILVKQATLIDSDRTIHLPPTDFFEKFKKTAKLSTKDFVESQGQLKGKEYFENLYTSKDNPWYCNISASRKLITTINRARSNHYNLAAPLGRIGIIDYTKCECEYGLQDLIHILWQCPQYNVYRGDLIKKLITHKEFPPYNITNILVTLNIKTLNAILEFLHKCDINI